MSRFYVGQRVRVVRSARGLPGDRGKPILAEAPIGRTGTVAGTMGSPNAGFNPRGAFDTSLRLDTGELGMCPSICLEPATDSHDKIEWVECIWQPAHLREDA